MGLLCGQPHLLGVFLQGSPFDLLGGLARGWLNVIPLPWRLERCWRGLAARPPAWPIKHWRSRLTLRQPLLQPGQQRRIGVSREQLPRLRAQLLQHRGRVRLRRVGRCPSRLRAHLLAGCACRGQQPCDGLVRCEPVPPGHRLARLRLQGGELGSVLLGPRVAQQRGRAVLDLLKQTLATARGMLRSAGWATEPINGVLRQIESALRQGKSAVHTLVNQWRTLRSLHTQVEALQAQAGRVLTPAQLADGSLLRQLAQIENSAATLLRHSGAQAHRAELTALQTQARQAVAGRYRLTVNKAVAGLLTTASAAGRQVRAQAAGAAPHAAQAYSAQALQQLLTQARQLLTAGADAPLLAALSNWLEQSPTRAPVLNEPGRGQSRQPAPAKPKSPGQREIVEPPSRQTAGEIEKRALQQRAEKLRRAADEARKEMNDPFNRRSDAQILADVASRLGVSAAEVMSALASLGDGPDGAQGVQAINSKHKKTILSLISQAGLEVVEQPVQTRGMHIKVVVRNKNGQQRKVFMPSTPSDQRWLQNTLGEFRRFARGQV